MSSVRDVESQQYPNPSDSSTVAALSNTRADAGQDGSVKAEDNDVVWVDWEGPDDPENPKKFVLFTLVLFREKSKQFHRSWPYRRKWGATLIVSAFTFISPVSSSMVAPAGMEVARQFNIHSPVLAAMTVSVFILGYGTHSPVILSLQIRLT